MYKRDAKVKRSKAPVKIGQWVATGSQNKHKNSKTVAKGLK